MSIITYDEGCDAEILAHKCDPCPRGEGGRVQGMFFYKSTFTWADKTDPEEWSAGILSGDIVIIPDVRGTYDGGTPKYSAGYGTQPQRYTGTDYKIVYFDPNWDDNEVFYNAFMFSRQWCPGFVGDTKARFFTGVATVFGKDPVEEDLNTEIVWNVEVSVYQKTKPTVADKPVGIFTCFSITD